MNNLQQENSTNQEEDTGICTKCTYWPMQRKIAVTVIVLQNNEKQNVELQNVEFQNIELQRQITERRKLQKVELQNVELQNVESYKR
jgi:hypothetical protein